MTGLRARIAALLAVGVGPPDLLRARAADPAATPEQVVTRLEAGRLPLRAPGHPTGDDLLVWGDGFTPLLDQAWDGGRGPLWLHHRGEPLPDGPCVGVVGTRRATLDGLQIAEAMAAELAASGVAVVSGMARGIDQAAHRGALRAGGRTTAVLGTGLDVDYPARSATLRAAVAASGGLVTEYPADQGVRQRWQFTDRNRILVGLCNAVVVVEAAARSGALNSATWAGDMGRDVLVVPASPSNPVAGGALALLRDGATPVRDAGDVLEVLGIAAVPTPAEDRAPPAPAAGLLSPAAGMLLPLLGPSAADPSALAGRAGLTARQVLVALSELEAVGLARRSSAGVLRVPRRTR